MTLSVRPAEERAAPPRAPPGSQQPRARGKPAPRSSPTRPRREHATHPIPNSASGGRSNASSPGEAARFLPGERADPRNPRRSQHLQRPAHLGGRPFEELPDT